uniref:Allregulin n=2 Tax=Propithecus coquereli TaxID=379532 RepID=A0A2K6FQY1_PROCO
MERGAAAAAEGRDGLRERRGLFEVERQQQNHEVQRQTGTNGLPKHSYWLDLLFFIILDVVLFIFVYLLP